MEKDGIACNLTLLFSLTQAIACAEANVTLISPFVGRILDWYKQKEGKNFVGADDPGVQSVTQIYNYYQENGYKTVVMGASFRNIAEIIELAGCDLLTISPLLLNELQSSHSELKRKLFMKKITKEHHDDVKPLDKKQFDWQLNENAMATEKLAEGIRDFARDQVLLESLLKQLVDNSDSVDQSN